MSSQRSYSYDSPFFILCNITSVEIDQNTFLVSPSYGLCLLQIPADASSPFLGQAFGASQENEPSPSVSHYGKTKYGDKIAPCGRKKSILPKRKQIGLCGRKKIACSKLSGRQYYS